MQRFRALPYACVALISFLLGSWIGTGWRIGSSEARAEEKSADTSLRTKVQSLQFVNARGQVKAELVVRDTRIEGRSTMQLALVDPSGRDVWSGPSEMKIIPTR